MHEFDCLIIGGGIVGLTAAVAMAKRNFTVAVIDAGVLTINTTEADPRVYAINRASQTLFQQLDVWPLLESTRISPYQHMHVWDAVTGAAIDFDARMIATNQLGSIIEESVIKNALLKKVQQEEKITLFPLSRVTKIDSKIGEITAATDEQVWQGKLLIIADGGNSPARSLLSIPITSWPYHQHAVVATVHTEKMHQLTAYQVFNPDGPLAFLPLTDPNKCSIVWSTTKAHANQLLALDEAEFNTQLSAAFAHKLGKATLIGQRYQFPLIMRHAKQYAGKNWLLMGDAAHTIHPLAGLGLNVGLADIAAWLSCLDAAGNIVSPGNLSAYQRQRKHAVWQSIILMEGLKTLFANPLSPIAALRGLGLRLCNQAMPLKRLFMQHAAG